MSALETRDGAADQPIVVHAPLSGDPQRIQLIPESLRSDDIFNAPAAPRQLPPGVGDPFARRAALTSQAAESQVRAYGLDAVRGLCLLAMNLTFVLPPKMLLPAWMYHMQQPPPLGEYVARAGITWQDIIFPGFVFAMAVAIPIRSSQQLASGEPMPAIIWGALKRTALLYLFALIIAHTNPYYTQLYSKAGNVLAIAGFLISFALFVRSRRDWNPAIVKWTRRAGWLGAAIVLFAIPPAWGSAFSLTRRDTIITAIAFVYFVCLLIWMLTRHRPVVRIVIMMGIGLLKVSAATVGAVAVLTGTSAFPWLYEPWFIELLLVAIPGTLAGDLLVEWMRTARAREGEIQEPVSRMLLGVAALGLMVPVVLLVGLYGRYLLATTALVLAIVALGALLLTRGQSVRDSIASRLGVLAGALLIVGILVEPLEGGIKKDPQTLSFLVLCAGLWLGVLLSATIAIDWFGGAARQLAAPIVRAGQNAMLAYVIFMLFLLHVAYLLGVGDILSATATQQAARGMLGTGLVMVLLLALARKGILWRA